MSVITVKRKWVPYLLIFPIFLFICVVIVYPFGKTIFNSFHFYKLNQPWKGTPFVGLEQYLLLLKDPRFYNSLIVTIGYLFLSLAGMLFVGLTTALLANYDFKLRWFFRATILLPWAVAPVVAAQAWKFMYNPRFGIINTILSKLGFISGNIYWLNNRFIALFSMSLTTIWKFTPLFTLIVLGGLQSLPNNLYKAAKIDGANAVQMFWYITLPLLRPFIYIGLLFNSLRIMNIIDIPYILTRGGPGNATEVTSLYTYRLFFKFLDFGKGSAMAVLIAFFTGLLIIFYVKKLVNYMVEGV